MWLRLQILPDRGHRLLVPRLASPGTTSRTRPAALHACAATCSLELPLLSKLGESPGHTGSSRRVCADAGVSRAQLGCSFIITLVALLLFVHYQPYTSRHVRLRLRSLSSLLREHCFAQPYRPAVAGRLREFGTVVLTWMARAHSKTQMQANAFLVHTGLKRWLRVLLFGVQLNRTQTASLLAQCSALFYGLMTSITNDDSEVRKRGRVCAFVTHCFPSH